MLQSILMLMPNVFVRYIFQNTYSNKLFNLNLFIFSIYPDYRTLVLNIAAVYNKQRSVNNFDVLDI